MENKAIRFWKIFAILLIVLNIILIGFLFLGPMGGRHPGLKEEAVPGNYLVEKLKLTPFQQTELKKLREHRHIAIMALQAEGKKLRKIFFDGLTSDPVVSNVDSIANKIADNQKQIELVTYNHFMDVKKMCTGEQRKIFNDIIQDVLGKMTKPPKAGERRIHSRSQK